MLDFFYFLYNRSDEILRQTLQHLSITLIALVFAILLGVFVGILLSRYKKLSGGALGILGIIQTIPSLALLGFMLPLLGIGAFPAIVALFLYALLPIVRNTFTGLEEVDAAVKEAAKGMGMSDFQILFKVELPLAIPVIFAGIRTAVVINVGVATLCALIAAGGLGEFIFRGIALNNSQMILAGAIPAALLALSLDSLLALIQKHIQQWLRPVLLGSLLLMIFVVVYTFLPVFSGNREFKAGFDAEFVERGDGWKGLQKHYGLAAIQTLEFDAGLMYQALKNAEVDLIGGYSTDGRIDVYDLLVLEDDKFYFPPYYAAPLVNGKTLEKYPELMGIFAKLEGKISDKTMRKLNFQVDDKGLSPKEIAEEFMRKNGFKISTQKQGKARIKIGGKKFTEQYILAEIFKILIESNSDLKVELRTGLGGTQIAFEALLKGEIDLYPEYTGTGLFVLLKVEDAVKNQIIQDKNKVYQYVKKEIQKRFAAIWLQPLGLNNTYALMMRKEQAKRLDIKTISDLKRYLEKK